MKKKNVYIVLALFVANSIVAANQFTLKGKMDSISSGTAVLTYKVFTGNQFKTKEYSSEMKQGQFQFKGELEEPIDAQLKIGKTKITLYIEPSKMELFIPISKPNKYILKGSNIKREIELYLQDSKDLFDESVRMNDQRQKIDQQIETTPKTDPNYNKLLEMSKLMSSQSDSIFALVVKKRITYIKSHPNSFQSVIDKSLEFLNKLNFISGDSARVLFNNLAEKVRLSTSGTETDLYIKTKENKGIVVGKMAPDFNTPDVNGKTIRLSDFRKKSYVLLDFWASWCIPCIKGIPHIKTLYRKYHDKGFEIISITKDESRKDWLSALKKYDVFQWSQVSSVRDLEKASQGYIDPENISEKYPTGSIPQYILIDKTGKIIGKWEGYYEENEKNQDTLLEEIFGE